MEMRLKSLPPTLEASCSTRKLTLSWTLAEHSDAAGPFDLRIKNRPRGNLAPSL